MAFQKTDTVMGFTANYWRIIQMQTDYENENVIIRVALYKDADTRAADTNAKLEQKRFSLNSTFLDSKPGKPTEDMRNNDLTEAYTSLKSLAVIEAAKPLEEQNKDLAFFSNAQDA